MGKYIVALVIGILIGNALRRVFEKYWMDILIGILYVAMFVLLTPLYIITLPWIIINTIINVSTSERKIVREYDRIFYQANTMEEVRKINLKITRLSRVLKNRLNKQKAKTMKELLKDAKWVI